MGLYRTKNRDELNQIAKAFAGEVSPEKFIEVYDYIMSDEEDRHVFMFIDLHKKDNQPSMFRKTTPTSLLCKAVLIRQSSVI